jgi:hypothetical protein
VDEDSEEDYSPARMKSRKKAHLWRLLILPFIPILALIVQTTLALRDSLNYREEVSEIEEQASLSFSNTKEKLSKSPPLCGDEIVLKLCVPQSFFKKSRWIHI